MRRVLTIEHGNRAAPQVVARIPPSALLDLHRLATLREVARCGSYAAAAGSLSFTPSAVSQQMAGLARDLGFELFERTPHGMRPTEAAELLVMHIERVFAQLGDAQGDLEAVAAGVRGRLRVGSFPAATVGFLAEAVETFRARFPHVDVWLADGEPYESVVRLKERELDLAAVFDFDHWALSIDRDGHLVGRDSEIECVDLFDDPFQVMLRRDHPLAERERIEIGDLAGERIISGPSGYTPWGMNLQELCRRAGFDPDLEPRYRTLDLGTLQAVVATGRGITLVPEMALLPEIPAVVVRPLVDGPVRHIRIAILAGVALSPAALAMVDLLQAGANLLVRSRPLVPVAD